MSRRKDHLIRTIQNPWCPQIHVNVGEALISLTLAPDDATPVFTDAGCIRNALARARAEGVEQGKREQMERDAMVADSHIPKGGFAASTLTNDQEVGWHLACDSIAAAIRQPADTPTRPKIVCLCGSTKFIDVFDREMLRLTESGVIVLTVGSHNGPVARARADDVAGTKVALDELHKRKIDLADSVLVLNVGGYIGNSTRSEIEYAKSIGRPVKFLEPADTPKKIPTGWCPRCERVVIACGHDAEECERCGGLLAADTPTQETP